MKMTEVRHDSLVPALIGGALVVALLLGLLIYGLWMLVSSQARPASDGWAVAATLLLIPAFLAGFWFGKTEVRGFLSGADRMLERMSGIVREVATIRESTRTPPRPAGQPPAPPLWQVAPPPPLQITYRTGGQDADDL